MDTDIKKNKEIVIRIIKSWDWPDMLNQTPQGKGVWGGIQFTFDEGDNCDYVLVLNSITRDAGVYCNEKNLWLIHQEPPNEFFRHTYKPCGIYSRVYTTDSHLVGERYIHTQTGLPWHINRSYDFLRKEPMPKKNKLLCWVTSKKNIFEGHKKRLNFLKNISHKSACDITATLNYYERKLHVKTQQEKEELKKALYAEGYSSVAQDKWEALSPYRYSLVVENFAGPDYWSEKLADAYLSYTMPIYYGCTNISNYFPESSYIKIDIEDPKCPDTINRIIHSNLWKRNQKTICKARELILEKYQFFPLFSEYIKKWKEDNNSGQKSSIILKNENSLPHLLEGRIKRLLYR
ncbi:hypothetical protein A3D77_02480 [Candidatus Gottesmanbacteria bacterium RIFCSPHIGHO2_02_FULL_39_11]|uniref:Fucosyltransferase C-terminal domain-containing protein n=1 Tax=Candidatus Gottesmanbacteria bacterium RIFCSPHIGHO2_02_FULL_39_11 TaxID=1798382 RepID=A0A1F5ZV48_9BACT|nr:MAG: hypothetical protein A3D77_02480 [Candidatus Gottesmanbacteria bacterium RIFCSPHIGHO2_02_FULL_39_11]